MPAPMTKVKTADRNEANKGRRTEAGREKTGESAKANSGAGKKSGKKGEANHSRESGRQRCDEPTVNIYICWVRLCSVYFLFVSYLRLQVYPSTIDYSEHTMMTGV